MNTDQIAAEAERRMWLGDNDKDRDQRRSCIKSAIEKAYREGYCDGGSASRQEDIAKFLPLVKQEIAAHSSPAEVRASERWDGALTASNKDMDARMAEAASASEPPPQELRMIHRNGDLRWEVNGKEEDFIASVEPSIASKICKAFYDKVYSRAAHASECPKCKGSGETTSGEDCGSCGGTGAAHASEQLTDEQILNDCLEQVGSGRMKVDTAILRAIKKARNLSGGATAHSRASAIEAGNAVINRPATPTQHASEQGAEWDALKFAKSILQKAIDEDNGVIMIHTAEQCIAKIDAALSQRQTKP